jgi:hypothetical protein
VIDGAGPGWKGVDLDGTLAEYHGWDNGRIGAPVPTMMKRVKAWLAAGREVRIVTARVAVGAGRTYQQIACEHNRVVDWCEQHIGRRLPVTASKDFMMLELWDDRVVHVEKNTGRILG